MLFLNTPGFEWRKNEEGNYDIFLAGIDEEDLPKEVYVSKAVESSIKDFHGNNIYKMICNNNSIALADEYIAFVTNEEKIIAYTAVLFEDDEEAYIEVRRYSDISSSEKYTIFRTISLSDDEEKEDTKRDSLTLEDLLGPAYKDTKLSMLIYENRLPDLPPLDTASYYVLELNGLESNRYSIDYQNYRTVNIDRILPIHFSVESIIKNPKLIRREEFKFIFGKKYIILSYGQLICSLYKTLHEYKKSIYELDKDNVTLVATKEGIRYL